MSLIRPTLWLAIVLIWTTSSVAQHHGGSTSQVSFHGHGGHSGYGGHDGMGGLMTAGPGGGQSTQAGGYIPVGAVSGGYGSVNYFILPQPTYYGVGGVQPFVPLVTPQLLMVGAVGQGMAPGGLMLPMPPPQLQAANIPAASPTRVRRSSPTRALQLIEIASRSFRANDIHRAQERYQQAIKADPLNPTPHLHLAQVSIVRGDYAAAAEHLRTAVNVADNPGWLLNVPDIQSIYAEPADFAKQVARIESHLQASPGDRNAWFVLGAQWYFSGRTQQASDVFQRLTDRRPDPALAAFLDASTPRAPNVP